MATRFRWEKETAEPGRGIWVRYNLYINGYPHVGAIYRYKQGSKIVYAPTGFTNAKFSKLIDAKKCVEKFYGLKRPKKKINNEYGIKGDWRPFEGM